MWIFQAPKERPSNKKVLFQISGPCSAETEEQLRESCIPLINSTQVDLLRAGVWKPRTRPNSFEGMGEKALPWLLALKEEFGIPFSLEIATPLHAELALKYQADAVWIGARTTVNPFAVQDIADALRGTSTAVMVKNPINPDVALWMGAIERLLGANLTKIAAIHRGFSSFEKSIFRNDPMWGLAIEFRRQFPNLPLICDPSHIGGKRSLIHQISQKALDLDYDGLMIEVHHSPDQAWSDPAQQLTPKAYLTLLSELHIRKSLPDTLSQSIGLEHLRQRIDRIDKEILDLLSQRMGVVDSIGAWKNQNNVAVFQLERWIHIFETRGQWATSLDLSTDFVAQLYKIIHDESIIRQTAPLVSEKEQH